MNGNLIEGIGYLIRGGKIIREPGLRKFVVAPLLVNLILFITLISALVNFISNQMDRLLGYLPGWLEWLEWLLWPLLLLALLLVVSYSFVTLANIIASPFNGLLAERVEQLLTGQPLPDTPWAQLMRDIVPTMVNEIRKLGYFVRYAIPIGLLMIFPVTTAIATPLWFAFTSWMLALEYLDYPMSNNRIQFVDVRDRAGKLRLTSFGFGLVIMLLSTVPLLNLIVMPAAVAGATAAWVERYQPLTKP
ncbi:MAG: sulfate transporter CysZ [Gammaproteobacteria bacterium]